MAQKILHTLFFSVAILLLSFSSTSSSYQYQTLVLDPLPSSSQTFSWPKPESLSPNSLSLPLSHINDLSPSSDVSRAELFNLRLQRDSLRVKYLTSFVANATKSPRGFSGDVTIIPIEGEYYINLGVGTPATNVNLILDTGSDVLWLQCLPCKSCYNQSSPIFNPAKSKSYATIPCGSPVCRKLQPSESSCVKSGNKTCLYEVTYSDNSQTSGDFATETLTFHGARFDHMALGCGHVNYGPFNTSAGLMGLGRGESSFVSQTKSRYNGKFSYCFVDYVTTLYSTKPKPSSTIIFGDEAIPKNAVFTPLLTNPNPQLATFYYVQLLGISVGGRRVRGIKETQFKIDPITGDGGVIIDSGTPITRLPLPIYYAFRDAFRNATKELKTYPHPYLLDTCYDLSGVKKVKLPTVVFHFAGADITLSAKSLLIELKIAGYYCLSFVKILDRMTIFGNIHQQGFRIAYDLVGSRVGFLPGAC